MFLPFSATHDIMHTSYSVKNEKHEKIVESTSTMKNVKNEIFFIFQKMISTAEITSQDATQTIFLHKNMFRWLYKDFMAPYANLLKIIFFKFFFFSCTWRKKNHQLFLPPIRSRRRTLWAWFFIFFQILWILHRTHINLKIVGATMMVAARFRSRHNDVRKEIENIGFDRNQHRRYLHMRWLRGSGMFPDCSESGCG